MCVRNASKTKVKKNHRVRAAGDKHNNDSDCWVDCSTLPLSSKLNCHLLHHSPASSYPYPLKMNFTLFVFLLRQASSHHTQYL